MMDGVVGAGLSEAKETPGETCDRSPAPAAFQSNTDNACRHHISGQRSRSLSKLSDSLLSYVVWPESASVQ